MLASMAVHGLLLLILVVGPAFLASKPKPVPRTTISLVDAKLVDNLLSQAAAAQRQATRPPATPPAQPPPRASSPPKEQPKPQPKPQPREKPPEKPAEQPKQTPKPKEAAKPKEDPKPSTPTTTTTRPSLLKPISREEARNRYHTTRPAPPQPEPDLAQYAQDIAELRKDMTPSAATTVTTAGASAVAMQNYFDYVLGVYDREWRIKNDFDGGNGTAKARIVIRRDGTVVDADLIASSGDAKLDATVKAVLRQVTRLRPFPDGATDAERVYTINFNLDGKVF